MGKVVFLLRLTVCKRDSGRDKKGGSGGEMKGHVNFVITRVGWCFPLGLRGVIREDRQKEWSIQRMIQLYLRFLCCTSAFLSLNILSLFFLSLFLFSSPLLLFFFWCMFFSSTSFVAFLFLFVFSLECEGYCLCYIVFLCPSPLPLLLVFLIASSWRFAICSPNVLSMVRPCSLVFKCFCSKHTVGVLLTLQGYSSMRVCCCNFFASQSYVLLQDAYCFSLTDFYSALTVIGVSE